MHNIPAITLVGCTKMYKYCQMLIFFLFNSAICYEVNPISPKRYVKPYSPYCERKQVFMVDFANGTIMNYDLEKNIVYEGRIPNIPNPSFMYALKSRPNQFIVSNHLSTAIVEWNGMEAEARVVQAAFSVETAPEYAQNNWNLAKASPQNIFFAGTYRRDMCGDYPPTTGAFYRYDKCRGVKKIIHDIKVTGGIQWNTRGNIMYVVDACRRVIWAYDFDGKTQEICNGRIVFTYSGGYGDPEQTIPLGLAIDTDDNLYLGLYYGGTVLKVNPRTGQIIDAIYLPGQVIGDLCWTGDNYEKLLITTFDSARNIYTGQNSNITFSPQSGQIFIATGLNAQGVPNRPMKI